MYLYTHTNTHLHLHLPNAAAEATMLSIGLMPQMSTNHPNFVRISPVNHICPAFFLGKNKHPFIFMALTEAVKPRLSQDLLIFISSFILADFYSL